MGFCTDLCYYVSNSECCGVFVRLSLEKRDIWLNLLLFCTEFVFKEKLAFNQQRFNLK